MEGSVEDLRSRKRRIGPNMRERANYAVSYHVWDSRFFSYEIAGCRMEGRPCDTQTTRLDKIHR